MKPIKLTLNCLDTISSSIFLMGEMLHKIDLLMVFMISLRKKESLLMSE